MNFDLKFESGIPERFKADFVPLCLQVDVIPSEKPLTHPQSPKFSKFNFERKKENVDASRFPDDC